ncbi:hypothetical protein HZH66_002132 [Vespula vulgaris]|uniref:Uncharacterized protein n=1 Tax=Vespula vulgaris TaxID=7454 RepID=A0A834NEY6_VESVU|nr:hypothetical protein HZH66_002132 [Vespula vulgaris]
MKVSGNNTPGPSEQTSNSDMAAITESAISTCQIDITEWLKSKERKNKIQKKNDNKKIKAKEQKKTWRQKNPTFLQEIEWTDKSSRANRADDKFSGQANDQSEQNITVHSSTVIEIIRVPDQRQIKLKRKKEKTKKQQNRNLLEYYPPPLSARLAQYHFKGWNSPAFAQ